MNQISTPPREDELNHLKSVVVGTFGPHNELTNILERLIKQRDDLQEMYGRECYNYDANMGRL